MWSGQLHVLAPLMYLSQEVCLSVHMVRKFSVWLSTCTDDRNRDSTSLLTPYVATERVLRRAAGRNENVFTSNDFSLSHENLRRQVIEKELTFKVVDVNLKTPPIDVRLLDNECTLLKKTSTELIEHCGVCSPLLRTLRGWHKSSFRVLFLC